MQTTDSSILPYISSHLLHALAEQIPLEGASEPVVEKLEVAVLFADISGFTPLTEALAKKGDEGPEEITRLLNHAFRCLIEALEAEGGDVVKFSGDAITVLFSAKDESLSYALRRAKQAGEALQEVMKELNPLQSSIGPVELGLKVGIGGGEVLTMQLGGMFQRWEYAIAGEGLLQATHAEGRAERGDVCLSPEAMQLIHKEALPPCALVRLTQEEASISTHHLMRRFVPESVLSWAGEAGLHKWLGVLRSMSVLFVGIGEFEGEDAILHLHQFMQAVQKVVFRLQGSINKLAVDDKGTVLLVMFGAPPFAHADDPLRGVRCALELQELALQQGLPLNVGVATGRVFAGPVGSDTRREYTVMGDTVNLAARLMGQGNGILCDPETARFTQNQIQFDALPAIKLKGKAEPLPVYRPVESLKNSEQDLQLKPMIGRQKELSRLLNDVTLLKSGQNRLILLKGDAGIGKTRLSQAFRQQLVTHDIHCLQGSGQGIEQHTSYWIWRDVLEGLFGLQDRIDAREKHVQERLQDLSPEDLGLLPLLNGLLELSFPETSRTENLDAFLRQQNLHQLIIRLCKRFGQEAPYCILLENLQWIDSLSWELLHELVWSLDVKDAGIFLLMTVRPFAPECDQDALGVLEHYTQSLELGPLDAEESTALVASNLGLPIGGLPEALGQLVQKRAEGNPFFIEELLLLLLEQKLVQLEDREGVPFCRLAEDFDARDVAIPDSLEGLLLARIDRLSPEQQLTLRVASVIGRSFSFPLLHSAMEAQTPLKETVLSTQLDTLEQEAFTISEDDGHRLFTFKNAVTQEVTYRSLLFQQRRELHQALARHLEATFVDDDSQAQGHLLTLLAYHWRYADVPENERRYARLAGEYAARQYANAEALRYFSRAIELTEGEEQEERYQLLLARESVYDILGKREEQKADLESLRELGQATGIERQIEVALRRLNFSLTTHDYTAAIEKAEQIVNKAHEIGDLASVAQALQQWGRTFQQQGNRQEAKAKLEEALELADGANALEVKATCLRHLGICYKDLNDLDAAVRCNDEALELCHQLGKRLDEAGLSNNAGILLVERDELDDAVLKFRQAWEIFQTLGSRRGVCVSLSNLGYYLLKCGQYSEALDALKQVVQSSHEINDKATECYGLSALGECFVRLGDYSAARESYQKALDMCRAIGHLYFEGYTLFLMAEALFYLGEKEEAASLLEKGLEIAERIGDPEMKATTQLLQGHLFASQEGLSKALEAYQKAAEGFASIPRHGERFAALAGIARLELQQDRAEAAMQTITPILQSENKSHLRYANERFWIGLTCVQVLQANGEAKAELLLRALGEQLQKRAQRIKETPLKKSFLEQVYAHSELQRLMLLL